MNESLFAMDKQTCMKELISTNDGTDRTVSLNTALNFAL